MSSAGAAPLHRALRALRALVGVGFILIVATCRDGMEPQVHLAPIAVAPIMPSDAMLASFGLAIDRVRFVVVRPSAPPDTLADTTVALPPDSATLDLALAVPLIAAAETLEVSIIALSGTIELFEGTAPVEVTTSAPSAPTEIPVDNYIGPGAGVDSIVVVPPGPFLFFNDSLRFQVEAFQAGVPVSQFYVSWTTSDTTVAKVNGQGLLRAPAQRTSVRVIARTPGDVASDSTTATFVPLPNQLLIISGAGQSGPAGQPLPTQLEVEVRAADNLPVPGVDVRFRSLSGGGPDTIVASDAQGRARVTAVLGATPGPQQFQASLPDFPSVPFAPFNMTATGVVISPATSLVTVASPSVVSGNTVKLRLQGKDASGADITTGGATVVFTRSGGGSTGSISATADSGNGVYTAVFTGLLAGTATTIGATINGAPVTTALPTIAVSPGAISTSGSLITVSSGTVTSGNTVTLRLQARDAAGNVLSAGGATVVFSASGGSSSGNIGVTTDSGTGVYTAPFTGVLAGSGTFIGATIGGNAVTSGQPSIIVTAGAPARLAFINSPSVAATGVAIAPALQVAARDLAGNATASFVGAITIGIGTNPGSGSLAGTLTQPAVAGVATFADLAIDLPGIGYTLSASAAAMAGDTTASFDVVPPSGTIFWANAAGGNWSNPANWSGGAVPSVIETAAITLPGNYTVTLDVSDTIAGLQVGGASGTQTLLTQNKTLHVSGTTQINATGVLDFRNSTLEGGTLSNGGTVLSSGSSTIQTSVVTSSGSLIRVQGNNFYGLGTLTVTNGFTNTGAIVLTDTVSSYGATLSAPAGVTLINGSAGTIEAAVGFGGPRTLALALDNQGTVTLNSALTINRAGAVHSNNGTIDLNGGDLTVTQTGTSPSFTTSGTITIAPARTMAVSGGALNYTAGAISGGTLSVTNGAVTSSQPFNTATAALTLISSTWGGTGTITVGPSTLLDVRNSTINAPLDNQSAIRVHGSSAFNGGFSNPAGTTLTVQGNNVYGLATLTVGTSFTNGGAIVLTDTISSYGATLSMPTGATLTNSAGGTIEAAVGFAGSRTLTAELDNQGTVTLNRSLTLSRAGAHHLNTGTIDVSGGDFTLTQSGITPSFGTAGSIIIGAGRTFSVSSGAFDYSAGTISGGGTLSLTSTTVTAAQDFSTATNALSIVSSTWGGTGTLTVDNGTSLLVRNSSITTPLVNLGTLISSGNSTFSGPFTTNPGTTLRVQGNNTYGLGTLTIADGFTNTGAIELTDTISTYGATLNVTAGALLNAPGGSIAALLGFNGPRTLGAQLDNQGTISVATAPSQGLTLAKASANHVSSGTIAVSGGDFALTQSGTSPSFTNTGAISVAAGDTFRVSSGAFSHDGGTLGGAGAMVLSAVPSAAFNVTHSIAALRATSSTVSFATPQSTGSTGFVFINSTVNGPGTLTNAGGRFLNVQASTLNLDLDNQGTLLVNGSSAFNGAVTTAPASSIRIQGNGIYGLATLTVGTPFTNNGTIELTDTISSYGATLSVPTGTLTNSSTGTIAGVLGSGGPRTLAAQLDNQGALTAGVANATTFTWGRTGANQLNSGAIDVTGGDLVLNQTAGTAVINTGTISVAAGDTLRINGGQLSHDAGTFGGPGTLVLTSLNPAVFNVAHTFATMIVNGSTVAFATPQSTAATAFAFGNSTVNGPALLTNDPGKTLRLRSTTVNAPFSSLGTLIAHGATSFTDTITTGPGSLIRIQGEGLSGLATLTVTKGFENAGTIELTDTTSSYGATLAVPLPGKLLNLAGGFVDAVTGSNGPRTLTAALDNQGSVRVNLQAGRKLTLNRSSAAHLNDGTIDVGGGDLAVSGAASIQNLGAINIAPSDSLFVTNGAFSYDAGLLGAGTLVLTSVNPATFNKPHQLSSIILNSTTASFAADQSTDTTAFTMNASSLAGSGTLTNGAGKTISMRSSSIAAPFVNQGTLLSLGNSSIDGPATTVAGSTIRIQGDGLSGLGTLTVQNGMVNNGTIELTDVTSTYGATLVVKTLPLVNAGSIDIQAGANGSRTIDAVRLDNQGIFTANQAVTISHADAQHTNRGTYKVKAGAITFAQSGTNESFTNQTGGIIDIDPGTVFRVTNGPVTNALGGKIVGFGTFDVRPPATFANDGEIIPGASPGKLTIAGNMQIPTTGTVTIELGGPVAGTGYDQLAITGNAIVAEGTLNVSTIGAFNPAGQFFDVVTFATGSGSFRNFTVPPGCGQPFNTGTSIRVQC